MRLNVIRQSCTCVIYTRGVYLGSGEKIDAFKDAPFLIDCFCVGSYGV